MAAHTAGNGSGPTHAADESGGGGRKRWRRTHLRRSSLHHHRRRSIGGHNLRPSAHQLVSYWAAIALVLAVCAVLGLTLFAFFIGSERLVEVTRPPDRNPSLSGARAFSNCTDFAGVVRAVQFVAHGEGYLHQFEFDRLHPCCRLPQHMVRTYSTEIEQDRTSEMVAARASIDDDVGHSASGDNRSATAKQIFPTRSVHDIVFVVVTRKKTKTRAKAVLSSWGRNLPFLLLVSDFPDSDTGAITFGEIASLRLKRRDDGHNRQIWALKHLMEDAKYREWRKKKWFFLADDDTWVNVPALLNLIIKYDESCPAVFGYVWSRSAATTQRLTKHGIKGHGETDANGLPLPGAASSREVDYSSGGAGMLLSQAAFDTMAPAFYTDECPFIEYNDVTLGACAWRRGVQLVHHRGFYFDPPERSKDHNEVVWLPPIAEALTYHYVRPDEMELMSEYVNQRWQFDPDDTAEGGD